MISAAKEKTHEGKTLDNVNGYNIIFCQDCGFKHITPLPSSEFLKNIYEKEYYSLEKPNYFKHYEEDKDWWNICYDDRYDYFEENLESQRRKILDVGSGPGLFLLRGKERGWETVGIEPSKQAATYSRNLGLNIINEFLTTKTQNLDKYDAIHMSEVLEHFPNPLEMLNVAYQLLLPGGYICIVVPNDYNPFQNALREVDHYAPWWLAPPHHINYFDPHSLKHILRKAGFNPTHISTTFPIDIFLLMGDDYTKKPELGRECHAKRKRFEALLYKAGLNDLKKKIYSAFINLDVGREIIIFAQKTFK